MKRAVLFVALASVAFGFTVVGGVPSGSTAVTTGFSSPVVLSGLEAGIGGSATAFAWAPDGRVFVARKKGVVDVYDHGVQHVFVDLRSEVNSAQGRGMLGLAVDPHFATNGWVYMMFTQDLDPTHPDSKATAGGEIIRLHGRAGAPDTADLATRRDLLAGYDSSAPQHADGALRFDGHGNLLASWGDATIDQVSAQALDVQHLDDLRGKIIRIDPDTGAGVLGNPWYDAAHPQSVRSKVYAYGFRNPYRFSVDPDNGTLYVGDVGLNAWEELDAFPPRTHNPTRDRNGGWPCYEGGEGKSVRQPLYDVAAQTRLQCDSLYPPSQGGTGSGAEPPLYAYPHDTTACITVGPKYAATSNYPAAYDGKVFVADWARDSFETVDPISGAATAFGQTGTWGQPVDIQIAPDGDVVYLAFATGQLREITYTP
jgi:glucose/arabinose dehydrogenase